MKLYYPIQTMLAILGIVFPLPLPGGERPPSAPPIDERVDRLEYRMSRVETKLGIADCPCPDGPCICDADNCVCPDCPEHKKSVAIWPDGRRFSGHGREVLFFTASWCGPCQAAKQRLGTLMDHEDFIVIDCSEKNPLAYKFGEQNYPTAIYCYDGEQVSKCVGPNVGQRIVGGWLNPEAYGDTPPEKRIQQNSVNAVYWDGSRYRALTPNARPLNTQDAVNRMRGYYPRSMYPVYRSYPAYYGGCATCR